MAKLVLCHVAKLSKIKKMWHLQMICSKFVIEVNPFFRPVFQSHKCFIDVFEIHSPFIVRHNKCIVNVILNVMDYV